jgi:hypothetical protein
MKKFVLSLCFITTALFTHAQGQNLPYIGTATILPQSPVAGDMVRIITFVTTPAIGGRVSMSHDVSFNPNEIQLQGCYWSGMATAIHEHRDTFNLGILPAGVYSVKQRAYLSSDPQNCTLSDSNMVMYSFTVATTTGINENAKTEELTLFPNPVKDILHLSSTSYFTDAALYSLDGRLIKQWALNLASALNVEDLPAGTYFIRFSNSEGSETRKLVKLAN